MPDVFHQVDYILWEKHKIQEVTCNRKCYKKAVIVKAKVRGVKYEAQEEGMAAFR